ncbi:MAG: ACT domain-containing protein [Caldilineaceae bacterium]|nr:ACT domain-containing protein [Caldilineaceae bacterium]
MTAFTLTLLPGRYAVCHLPPPSPIPPWANGDGFCSITRTADELSIICPQDSLPGEIDTVALDVARNWVLLRVEGPFDFDVTGVLATLSAPLAAAGVVLLAVATYQTDYLLFKAEQQECATQALSQAGHRVAI